MNNVRCCSRSVCAVLHSLPPREVCGNASFESYWYINFLIVKERRGEIWQARETSREVCGNASFATFRDLDPLTPLLVEFYHCSYCNKKIHLSPFLREGGLTPNRAKPLL